jgi:hypothetical protein
VAGGGAAAAALGRGVLQSDARPAAAPALAAARPPLPACAGAASLTLPPSLAVVGRARPAAAAAGRSSAARASAGASGRRRAAGGAAAAGPPSLAPRPPERAFHPPQAARPAAARPRPPGRPEGAGARAPARCPRRAAPHPLRPLPPTEQDRDQGQGHPRHGRVQRHVRQGQEKKSGAGGEGARDLAARADAAPPLFLQRLDSIGMENTEANRLAYRELLVTTPGIGDYISGAILFEETLYQVGSGGVGVAPGSTFFACSDPDTLPPPPPTQTASTGDSIVQILNKQGIVPGIKTDKGLVPMVNANGESWCQGLDGLAQVRARSGGERLGWVAGVAATPKTLQPKTINPPKNLPPPPALGRVLQAGRPLLQVAHDRDRGRRPDRDRGARRGLRARALRRHLAGRGPRPDHRARSPARRRPRHRPHARGGGRDLGGHVQVHGRPGGSRGERRGGAGARGVGARARGAFGRPAHPTPPLPRASSSRASCSSRPWSPPAPTAPRARRPSASPTTRSNCCAAACRPRCRASCSCRGGSRSWRPRST